MPYPPESRPSQSAPGLGKSESGPKHDLQTEVDEGRPSKLAKMHDSYLLSASTEHDLQNEHAHRTPPIQQGSMPPQWEDLQGHDQDHLEGEVLQKESDDLPDLPVKSMGAVEGNILDTEGEIPNDGEEPDGDQRLVFGEENFLAQQSVPVDHGSAHEGSPYVR